MGKEQLSRLGVITRVCMILGLVLLAAGFAVRDIRAAGFVQTDYVAWGLGIAGVILAGGGIMANYRVFVRFVAGGRATERLNFAAVVALSLALAGMLCYITTRRFARMDWTGKRTYSLHSKTKNILRALDRDVEATVIYAPDTQAFMAPDTQALMLWWLDTTLTMLEEFRALSNHITVKELNWTLPENLTKVEGLRQRLGEQSLPGTCVVLAGPDAHQIVPFEKTVEGSRTQEAPAFTGEDAFASALVRLTEEEKVIIYALTGHGERSLEEEGAAPMAALRGDQLVDTASDPRLSLSRVVRELRNDSYDVKPLSLVVEGSVPDDCAALLIAGPRTPLAEKETKALEDYLDNRNGNAVFLVDSEVLPDVETNVDDLLLKYGVRLRTDAIGVFVARNIFGQLVFEADVPVQAEGLAKHPATSGLANYTIWFKQPCPIEIAEPQPRPMLSAQPLLTGVQSSWGETDIRPDEPQEVEFTPDRDAGQPAVVGVVVQPTMPPGAPPMSMSGRDLPGPRLIVLGSSLSFVNAVAEQHPENVYLLQNCVNWMAGKMHMLGIPPKRMELNVVSVSESAIRAARYIFIGGLPACIIAVGIGVYLLRRR
ncbi:MAG: GldG family protein [Planctomycetota bacterium]|jgi:hypothetical protein